MIHEFQGEYRWLSNFSIVKIPYGGLTFPSVEHFYVAMKSKDPDIRKEISKINTPANAKHFGKTIEIRGDWDTIKLKVMKYGLNVKYNTEPYKTQLIETGKRYIQEGNRWGDKFFGVCLKSGEGLNVLGEMIMDIRDELMETKKNEN